MEIFFPQVKKPKFLRAGKIQIRGSFAKDLTTYLPNEIWLRILMKLDQLSLGRMCAVNRRFHQLARDPSLWLELVLHFHWDWAEYLAKAEAKVAACTRLERFTLANTMLRGPPQPWDRVAELLRPARASLTSLTLGRAVRLTGPALRELASQFPRLACLNLQSGQLGGRCVEPMEDIKEIARMNRLVQLGLSGSWKHSAEQLEAVFLGLTCLKWVDLSSCRNGVTDQSLATLVQSNSGLEHLNLSNCPTLSGFGLFSLSRHCPLLTHLDLSGGKYLRILIEGELEEIAAGCPALITVHLQHCSLTDSGLLALARHCHGLRELDISFSLQSCRHWSSWHRQPTQTGLQQMVKDAKNLKRVFHTVLRFQKEGMPSKEERVAYPEVNFELFEC